MINLTPFVPRLFGVPCDQVNIAIVTQIKAMGSYKVRNLLLWLILLDRGCSFQWKIGTRQYRSKVEPRFTGPLGRGSSINRGKFTLKTKVWGKICRPGKWGLGNQGFTVYMLNDVSPEEMQDCQKEKDRPRSSDGIGYK